MIELWIVSGVAVAFGLLLLLFLIFIDDKEDWPSSLPFLGAGIIVFIVNLCITPKFNSSYQKYVCDIVSISRENNVSGSFALGYGQVRETSYYYYYTKQEHGYKLEKVDTETSFIVETNDKTPCIYECKESKTFKKTYLIYVPEGTIITTYVLN